jgi:hypothetical protein
MFIGHYSAALVAAAHRPAPKLGILFVAAQIVDVGFFAFVLTGVESMRVTPGLTVMNPLDFYYMPYTHSLLASFIWAAGFALVLRAFGISWRGAIIAGAVVLSHWFLDLLVHAPDLTLAGLPPKLGLALWNYPAIEMPLEIGLTSAALFYYLKSTQPTRKSFAVPVLILFLAALQAINWSSPPPATIEPALPLSALSAYGLAIAIAIWVAHNRRHREE